MTEIEAWLSRQQRRDEVASALCRGGVEAIDVAAVEQLSTWIVTDPEIATFHWDDTARATAARAWESLPENGKLCLQGGVLLAAGALALEGVAIGDAIPDKDITLLGIGYHRFWALHSAAAAWVARDFVQRVDLATAGETANPLVIKLAASAAAGGAVGIGIHLLKDGAFGKLDGQKSVVFGVPGLFRRNTLVKGTYLDDDAWLLGNSLWAFKIASDLLVLAYGDDFAVARAWARSTYQPWIEAQT